MLVTCIDNRASRLPSSLIGTRTAIQPETEFPLTVGQAYVVYALTIWHAYLWYYVLDDDHLLYPVWTPAPLFDVTDGGVPGGWCIAYYRMAHDDEYPIISFPEWANDRLFYERLVDGDEDAQRIFASRKAEIDFYHSR